MMNCKLTVIIPTYNAEDHILESVHSVKEQSFGFENIELILVDDNSKDSTKSILKELSEKHENIKSIFLEENSGTASKPRKSLCSISGTSPQVRPRRSRAPACIRRSGTSVRYWPRPAH